MTTIALRTLQNNIHKSAKRLDRTKKGWAKKIDLSRFRMSSAFDCLAGQLKIWDTVPKIKQAFKRGFYCDGSVILTNKGVTLFDNWSDKVYNVMQRLWLHQINKRIKV